MNIPTTKMPKFKVTKHPKGYRIELRTHNGRVLLTTQYLETPKECLSVIEKIRINCVLPERYVRGKNFHLTDSKGVSLGIGPHYPTKRNVERAIESVMVAAPRAEVDMEGI